MFGQTIQFDPELQSKSPIQDDPSSLYPAKQEPQLVGSKRLQVKQGNMQLITQIFLVESKI